jgi:hypothetical protein
MSRAGGRRDRVSGRVVVETLRYREVMVERAAGRSSGALQVSRVLAI